jgi:hypothetical protein
MSRIVDGWLVADRDVPKKQRHTARRVRQRLVAEHGAACSEITVSRYVARRRVKLGLKHVEVSVPQIHEPGATPRSNSVNSGPASAEACQVLDVRHAVVLFGEGVPRRVLRATDLRVCEVPLREMCDDHLAVNGRRIVNSRSPFRSFALGILGRRLPWLS